MKKQLLLLLSIFVFPLLTGFGAGWYTYKDPLKTFTLEFPKAPVTTSQSYDFEGKPLKVYYADCKMAASDKSNLRYSCITTEFPDNAKGLAKQDIFDEALEKGVNGLLKENKGKLIWSKKTNLEGQPAVIAEIMMMEGQVILSYKSCIANDRLVALKVYTLTAKKGNADCKRFLNSLKLVKK